MSAAPDAPPGGSARPRRRGALVLGVGTVAAAMGAGAAVWRARHPATAGAAGFWDQVFEAPDGGTLALAGFRGRPLLLNFWATWCPPCVGEMPLLERFHRERQAGGWAVVGIAVDNREPVTQFLASHPVTYPIGLAGAAGVRMARELGNTGGALPFSVVFGADGGVVQRKLGVLDESDLRTWSAALN